MKITARLNNLKINQSFDLSSKEGKRKFNRFISEIYSMYYYLDDDDFTHEFVDIKDQYPHVFNNFANQYIHEEEFIEEGLDSVEERREYLMIDEALFIDENIDEYIKEEMEIRKYLFELDYENILNFISEYLHLEFIIGD